MQIKIFKRSFKISRKLFIIIIAILLFAGYFFAKPIFKNPADSFVLESVKIGNVLQEISETGSVKATEDLSLGFKTIGKIKNLSAAVGADVKQGQILAELDSGQLSAQLEAAKASLRSATNKYDKLINGSTPEEIKAYENDVAAAEDNLESAYDSAVNTLNDAHIKSYNAYRTVISIYESYFTTLNQPGSMVKQAKEDISEKTNKIKSYLDSAKSALNKKEVDSSISGTITQLNAVYNDLKIVREQADEGEYYSKVSSTDKSSLDTQKGYINTALTSVVSAQQDISSYKIALQTAQDDLAKEKATPRAEDIDIYRSDVEVARANVDLYQSQLNDVYLRAPIDGKITQVSAKRGETVSANEPVVTLLSSEPFQIKVDIYEQDIVNVKPHNPVKINLVAFPKETFLGKVLSIDPGEKLIDNVVYYEVTVEFPSQPAGVKSGMTADIVIETNKKENVLRVPKNSVENIDGKETIQIFKAGKVENREIETGLEGNDYFEVLSGAAEGEQIVMGKK